GGLLQGLRSLPSTVTADRKRLTASVLSGPLTIPAKDALMRVTVDAGVRSSQGGTGTDEKLGGRIQIPGLFSLAVQNAQLTLVRNERYEPEQVLVLSTSADVGEKDMQQSVTAWILPVHNPSTPQDQRVRPYVWDRPEIIGPEILAASTRLTLRPGPAGRARAWCSARRSSPLTPPSTPRTSRPARPTRFPSRRSGPARRTTSPTTWPATCPAVPVRGGSFSSRSRATTRSPSGQPARWIAAWFS